jgi:hypothetical protein
MKSGNSRRLNMRKGVWGKIGGGVSLVLVTLMLFPSGALQAKEREGARLIVFKKDGARLEGELIAVRQNLLLVMPEDESAAVFIDVSDVTAITFVKKSKALSGAGWGALWGLGAGLIVGFGSIGMFFCAEIGVGAGAALGFFFGAAEGIDQTVRVERLNESQVQRLLRSLWSKARIQNYT